MVVLDEYKQELASYEEPLQELGDSGSTILEK